MCLTLTVNNSYTITTKNLTALLLFFQLYIRYNHPLEED